MTANSDIIEPEPYEAFCTVLWEGMLRPGWIILETDRWKLSLYVGKQRRAARAAAGLGNVQFRHKAPYARFKPELITLVGLVRENGTGPVMVHPYYDAVDVLEARRSMDDRRCFTEVDNVHRDFVQGEAPSQHLTRLLQLAELRCKELNQRVASAL